MIKHLLNSTLFNIGLVLPDQGSQHNRSDVGLSLIQQMYNVVHQRVKPIVFICYSTFEFVAAKSDIVFVKI